MEHAFLAPPLLRQHILPVPQPRICLSPPALRRQSRCPRAILRIPINPSGANSPGKHEPRRPPLPPVNAKSDTEAAKAIECALAARLDCLITGFGSDGRIAATLQAHPRRFNALVLTPTRMTAEAAAAEIGTISGSSRVIVVVGRGIGALSDPARTAMYHNNAEKGTVVVATPRAICNAFFRTGQGPKWLALVDRLVLSDPPQMTEIGCLRQVYRILKFLPVTARRQTVLLARENPMNDSNGAVTRLASSILRSRVQTVVWPGEAMNPATRAARIPQRFSVASPESALAALGAALEDARRTPQHKVVVFLPTAKLVQFYAELFRALGVPSEELHGRRSPSSQTRALTVFSESEQMILFSSEMSAARAAMQRVTHVLQIGAPKDPAQYLRRVAVATSGEGSALLMLCDFERDVGLNVIGETASLLETPCYSSTEEGGDSGFVDRAHEAVKGIPWQLAAGAYMSWLAEYATKRKALGWTREELVRRAAEWARLTTGSGPWSVPPRYADRLKLWRVPGIVVAEGLEYHMSFARETGMINWDRSLDDVEEIKSGLVGPRGRNVMPRRLKEKKPKIEDWRQVLKRISVKDLETLKTINRRSPEGKKFMAAIVQQALAVSESSSLKKKKKKSNPPKKKKVRTPEERKRKKERIRSENWAPPNLNIGGK